MFRFLQIFTALISCSTVLCNERISCTEKDGSTCTIRKQPIITPNVIITHASHLKIVTITIERSLEVNFLPIEISQVFPSLEKLEGNDCNIRSISRKSLSNLKDLNRISLNKNMIHDIEVGAFDDLESLISLFLDGNKIKTLRTGVFAHLKKLKLLALRSNEIKILVENLFVHNQNLEMIWLENNELQLVSSETFTITKNLQLVELHNNKCINESFNQKSLDKLPEQFEAKCSLDVLNKKIESFNADQQSEKAKCAVGIASPCGNAAINEDSKPMALLLFELLIWPFDLK